MKYFSLIIIALLFFANTLLYSALPNQIPMHWNINGQIDSYMPKDYGLWLLPIICLIMWISFQIIPYFDPKKEKYQLFAKEWQIMQTGIVVFMSYVHSLILYITLNPQTPMLPPMFFGLGSLFILFGNYLSKIRQNYFIGVKTPWT